MIIMKTTVNKFRNLAQEDVFLLKNYDDVLRLLSFQMLYRAKFNHFISAAYNE